MSGPYDSIGTAQGQVYTLLSKAGNVTGPIAYGVRGGDYIWRCSGTFGGATVTLQQLDLDGSTWVNVRNAGNTADLTMTATGQVGIGIGQGASIQAVVTGGTGASINSSLSGLS